MYIYIHRFLYIYRFLIINTEVFDLHNNKYIFNITSGKDYDLHNPPLDPHYRCLAITLDFV